MRYAKAATGPEYISPAWGATIARGGGALAYGVVVGLAFALLGAGRLYLARGQ